MNYYNTKLTVELGELVENGINVWDFDYPSFYKDEKKTAFEQLVLDHYRFRQIGMETPGRWLHSFRTRIREIMPYYIQLYETVELMASVEDPFKAYDLTETFTKHTTGKGSSTDTVDSESEGSLTRNESSDRSGTTSTSRSNAKQHKFSNTPQGSISNLDSYMTEASEDNDTETENNTNTETASVKVTTDSSDTVKTTSTGEHDTEGSETYELKRFGNIGVQPLGQEIEVYRKALINVDMMVINELNDLFLKVY